MFKSFKSIKDFSIEEENALSFAAYEAMKRDYLREVGWMGMGGDAELHERHYAIAKVIGMPGTLAVIITGVKNLPKTWSSEDMELVVKVKQEDVKDSEEVRCEPLKNLIKSKSLEKEGDQGLVAKRRIVFSFEIPQACTNHSVRIELRGKHSQSSKVGLARLFMPMQTLCFAKEQYHLTCFCAGGSGAAKTSLWASW